MTTTLQRIDGPGDAELIAAVRDGDPDAYGLLFERHVEAARRLARQLLRGPDADDLVSEAFAKVLVVLQRGAGPDVAFRAYLLTAVRRLHVDRLRRTSRVQVTDDLTPFDPGVPFRDTAVEGFDSAAAARAFASLPERWQLVLWHTEVEEQKPAEVAPLLGMSANSVSALAYRAREGLRQAFLTMHADVPDDDTCAWVHGVLGGYVRGTLARRDATKVEGHLETCRPCAAVLLELTEVNSSMSGLLAPALLGSAAAAYVASASTAGSTVAAGGMVALVDRAKDVVVTHAVTSSVAGAAATAVIGGAVLVTVRPDTAPAPGAAEPPTAVAPSADPPAHVERHEREPAPPARSRQLAPVSQPPVAVDPPVAVPDPSAGPVAHGPESAEPPRLAPGPREPQQSGGTEPAPAAAQYDVALRTSTSRSGRGVTRITVTVTGLPPGRTATLTSRGKGLVVALATDPRCLPTGVDTSRCAVDASPGSYAFLAHAPGSGSMTFEVAVDGAGTDSDPANNHSSVPVS